MKPWHSIYWLAVALATMGHTCGYMQPMASAETALVPEAPGTYAVPIEVAIEPPAERFVPLYPSTRIEQGRVLEIYLWGTSGESVVLDCGGGGVSEGFLEFGCSWRERCSLSCSARLTRAALDETPIRLQLELRADGHDGDYYERHRDAATIVSGDWQAVQL